MPSIVVNGEQSVVPAPCTVAALLERLGVTGRIAVEINGEIVPRSQLGDHALNDGDRIEIVRAIGGG
jgi:sulfur carrier protein